MTARRPIRPPAAARRGAARPPYRLSVEGCMAARIGTAGLTQPKLDGWLRRTAPHMEKLRTAYRDGTLPLLAIPSAAADIDAAEVALARLAKGAETIVFFGTGGSSLGGQTLAQIAGWNIPGDAGPEQRQGPRTRFYDNLDARTLERTLGSLDLRRTRFVVISKSGGTAETLVQMVAALGAARAAGLEKQIPAMFLGLTEPARPGVDNALRRVCDEFSIPMLDHDPGIGGRFSALTNVGLLPALTRGLDVRAVRAGAQAVLEALVEADGPAAFAPALGAAAAVGLMQDKGVRTLVMLPYADRLESFSAWWVQLWAESLGKDGQGSQPVAALGPLDQHSQLQLWMDGPPETLITVLRLPSAGTGPKLDPALAKLAGIGMLAGRRVGDLVEAQAHAIPDALARAKRAVRVIECDRLDEATIGGLMMHAMLETILAAGLLGVDPFGQPAVELAKVLARERLGGK